MNKKTRHTQEFKEIIERMPDNNSSKIVYGLVAFIIGLIILSVVIHVPDKVIAEVRVTSTCPPIVMKAQVAGRIKLLNDSLPCIVNEGDYIAVIDNPSNPYHMKAIKEKLTNVDIIADLADSIIFFDSTLFLGEIEPLYFNFKQQLSQYHKLMHDNKYLYELKLLDIKISNDSIALIHQKQILKNNEAQHKIIYLQYKIDSTLFFDKGIILENDYNKSHLDLLHSDRQLVNSKADIHSIKQSILDSKLRKESSAFEHRSATDESRLKLEEAYHSLVARINDWENNYVLKAPLVGTIELANVITNDSYVSVGEPIFNAIFEDNDYYGIAILPATGAGNVKKGQKVNLKMELYPYQEYGTLTGQIVRISLTTLEKNYLVYIELPEGLRSSNKSELIFAETMYGQAEIMTDNKRLISKIFHHIYTLISPKNSNATAEEDVKNEKKPSYQF